MPEEDRLDRNWRSQTDGAERIKDQLNDFGTKVAVLTTKLESLTDTVKVGLGNVDTTFREFNSRYATKEDCSTISTALVDAKKSLKEDIDDIRKNITKGVWIVLTAVILAVLTSVFRAGLLHA